MLSTLSLMKTMNLPLAPKIDVEVVVVPPYNGLVVAEVVERGLMCPLRRRSDSFPLLW